MEETKEIFEGAIFNQGLPNEKRFPFVRVTVAKQQKIAKKFQPSYYRAIIGWFRGKALRQYLKQHPDLQKRLIEDPEDKEVLKELVMEGLIKNDLNENIRVWKKTRSVAFNWEWKWLGYVPKELRCPEIDLDLAGELQADFFVRVREMVKRHDAHLRSLNNSQIQKQETN